MSAPTNPEQPKNWRRGLCRVWLIGFVPWAVATAAVQFDQVDKLSSIRFEVCNRQAGTDTAAFVSCWMAQAPAREAAANTFYIATAAISVGGRLIVGLMMTAGFCALRFVRRGFSASSLPDTEETSNDAR